MPDFKRIYGVDFSSSPSKRKPIVVSQAGWLTDNTHSVFELQAFHRFSDIATFEAFLAQQTEWMGGFDMPFGLSRHLLDVLQWAGARRYDLQAWDAFVDFYAALDRAELRTVFQAWCNAHPPGQKFAHRACDRPAQSSPSMKWINPPVAYMLHAGAPLLKRLDAHIPQQRAGNAKRVALEAYPGFLAKQCLGRRSYKNDDASKQSDARQQARQLIIEVLLQDTHGFEVRLASGLKQGMLEDPKGDVLDAALCAFQVAQALHADPQNFMRPDDIDPLEGWILTVPHAQVPRHVPALGEVEAALLRASVLNALPQALQLKLAHLQNTQVAA